jgi:hypothetical protein
VRITEAGVEPADEPANATPKQAQVLRDARTAATGLAVWITGGWLVWVVATVYKKTGYAGLPHALGPQPGAPQGLGSYLAATIGVLIAVTLVTIALSALLLVINRLPRIPAAIITVAVVAVGTGGLHRWAGSLRELAGLAVLSVLIAGVLVFLPRLIVFAAKRLPARTLTGITAGFGLITLYYLVAAAVLPADTVNSAFTAQTWPLLLAATLTTAGLTILAITTADDPGPIRQPLTWPTWRDLVFVIPPIIPVIGYIEASIGDLSLLSVVETLLLSAFTTGILVFLLPSLFVGIGDVRGVRALASAALFTVWNMASESKAGAWVEIGDLSRQLLVLLVAALLLTVLSIVSVRLLSLILVVFFLLQIASSAPAVVDKLLGNGGAAPFAESHLEEEFQRSSLEAPPDIYFLVYDGYPNRETLRAYGIDSADQTGLLKRKGFEIYDGTYSLGPLSLPSMGKVLAATHLCGDNIECVQSRDEIGSKRRLGTFWRKLTSGDSPTVRALSSAGYETAGIFSSSYYFLDGTKSSYDYSFPSGLGAGNLMQPMMHGEFVAEPLTGVTAGSYLGEKRKYLSAAADAPRFLYSHDPHPGHSSQAGACPEGNDERFQANLVKANATMEADLDSLGDKLAESIVIIAGDHGPYLTKNCFALSGDEADRLDIQDRYGTFLAIHWPEGMSKEKVRDITVLQDLFPAVLSLVAGNEKIWRERQIPREIPQGSYILGDVGVKDSKIVGGVDDGEKLFLSRR